MIEWHDTSNALVAANDDNSKQMGWMMTNKFKTVYLILDDVNDRIISCTYHRELWIERMRMMRYTDSSAQMTVPYDTELSYLALKAIYDRFSSDE
jgi:hypothetical protein